MQPLPCFGCGWDCYFGDAPCVRTISPASVRRALEQFLQDEAEGQRIFEAEGLEPGARALIDKATPRLRFLREDSADRLRQIQRLTFEVKTLDAQRQADRTGHEQSIVELTALLQTSETDRAARLRQIEELTALLQTSEADRAARWSQIEQLTLWVKSGAADCAAQAEQIEKLHKQIEELSARGRTPTGDSHTFAIGPAPVSTL